MNRDVIVLSVRCNTVVLLAASSSSNSSSSSSSRSSRSSSSSSGSSSSSSSSSNSSNNSIVISPRYKLTYRVHLPPPKYSAKLVLKCSLECAKHGTACS